MLAIMQPRAQPRAALAAACILISMRRMQDLMEALLGEWLAASLAQQQLHQARQAQGARQAQRQQQAQQRQAQ